MRNAPGNLSVLRDASGVSDDSKESEDSEHNNVPAWEQIEAGRYRPRRIRGSLRGRELG